MLTAADVTVGSSYDYLYDDLGRLTQTTADNGGPIVVLGAAYDAAGRRTGLQATVGPAADFQSTYFYDQLGRLTRVTQQAQAGGNPVAEKRVDFAYTAAGEFDTITRYKTLAGNPADEVAATALERDGIGRLAALAHSHQGTPLVEYSWTFDAASRITQYVNSIDGTSDYGYDRTDQLTSAEHSYQDDEAYAYDLNGNRESANGQTYTPGGNNQLYRDGVYEYQYDDEGNLTRRADLATGTQVVQYTWDYRNRLTWVEYVDQSGVGPAAGHHPAGGLRLRRLQPPHRPHPGPRRRRPAGPRHRPLCVRRQRRMANWGQADVRR